MATDWFFKCSDKGCNHCKKEWRPPLGIFEMLKEKVENPDFPKCNCGRLSDVFMTFGFGLHGRVLHCFCPSPNVKLPEWRGRYNQTWKYYPFLVIVDPDDKEEWGKSPYLWFPYWHVVGREETKKYGQWAQCLPADIFADLLRQARNKGYEL